MHAALLNGGEERFFQPAYLGSRGWIGLRLDLRPATQSDI